MLTSVPWPEDWRARRPRAARALALLLHPYVLFLAVTFLVFWPEGFNIGPANDGWRYLSGSPMQLGSFGPRFLGNLPKVLGMHLVSGGFQGWESVLLCLTALRGMLFYEIVRRLFAGFPLFALCCGLIALFHPADTFYFWMDSIGVDFAFVLALAACLAALLYVQTGSRTTLAALLVFTFLTCFTYTAFQPLILAFPIGVWLLARVEGSRPGVPRLVAVILPGLLCIAFQAVFVVKGDDREGAIRDFNLQHVLGGYSDEMRLFWQSTASFFTQSMPQHLLLALLAAAYAWLVAAVAQARSGVAPPPKPWRYYALLVPGLLLLAAISYLPFAVSQVRFGNQRQLFAAGIFIFMLALLPVCMAAVRRLDRRFAAALAGLVALVAVVMGMENRAMYVSVYRVNERLLAAVAAALPDPPKGAFIVVHMNRPKQVADLAGLYNRRINIDGALQFMYGDSTLEGAFTDIYQPPFRFLPGGVEVTQRDPGVNAPPQVPYGRLIIVDYPARGPAQVLDRAWLQQLAPKGADLSGYKSGGYGSIPGSSAVICTMLESSFRPAYCS